MDGILAWGLVLVVATGAVWQGSVLLEGASERLSSHYRIPDGVQGAVIVAVGSSFPELSTTVLAGVVHGEFELGISAIVGSAIFNILVIPGVCGVASKEPLQVDRDLIYKESLFYMLAVAVLAMVLAVAVALHPQSSTEEGLSGRLTRGLSWLPLALYGLYVFIQWRDAREGRAQASEHAIRVGREWGRLALSLALIVVGVEGLLRTALHFGEAFGTPAFLWGMTVVAAATSVPDAFVSVRLARVGRAQTSLGNVLGSNTFDLLVCIPVGVLVAGPSVFRFDLAAPLLGLLGAGTVLLFVSMRLNMQLFRSQAALLIVAYGLFVLWLVLESYRVTRLLPTTSSA